MMRTRVTRAPAPLSAPHPRVAAERPDVSPTTVAKRTSACLVRSMFVAHAQARCSMIPAPTNANRVCKWFLVVLLSSFSASPSAQTRGQAGQTPPPGGGPRTPVVVSPAVLPDRRVVVRLHAPQGRDVRMIFERGGQPLTKDNDGVWQATLE